MKKWEKPQLIVLTRSQPQEAVLQVCKWQGSGTVPMSLYNGCEALSGAFCFECDEIWFS